jgi:hypothetical protein
MLPFTPSKLGIFSVFYEIPSCFFLEMGVLPASASIDAHSHFIAAKVFGLITAWS